MAAAGAVVVDYLGGGGGGGDAAWWCLWLVAMAAATVGHIPSLVRALRAQSVKGIVFSFFVHDWLAHTLVALDLGSAQGADAVGAGPLADAAPHVLLAAHDVAMVLYMCLLLRMLNRVVLAGVSVYVVFVYMMAVAAGPAPWVAAPLHAALGPLLFAWSRGRQIWSNWKHRSSGQLAPSTVLVQLIASVALAGLGVVAARPVLAAEFGLVSVLHAVLLWQVHSYSSA